MTKYNLFEELMNVLRSEAVTGERGKTIMNLFKEFKSFPKEKVGNKFVTHFEVPNTNGVFEDRKTIDLVQDSVGNILGLRADSFAKNGDKLSTLKITPSIKSETIYHRPYSSRLNRIYDGNRSNYIRYNVNGTDPILI